MILRWIEGEMSQQFTVAGDDTDDEISHQDDDASGKWARRALMWWSLRR